MPIAQRSVPGADWNKERNPETASRSVREYLETLDEAAWGAATDVEPKFVSPSDPAAQWTGAMRGPAFFAYADNYLVDVHSAIIVDVEASRAVRQPKSVRPEPCSIEQPIALACSQSGSPVIPPADQRRC
jgi:hypothetical protein